MGGNAPTVKLAAAYSKRRRQDILPLYADVAKLLTEHLKGKPLDGPVWPGTRKEDASAKMIRMDLRHARMAWIAEATGPDRQLREQSDRLTYRDAEGKCFDFRAFRGQFISDLCRLGIHPKKIQQLARHGNINLTMQVYTHVSKSELMESVAVLPPPPLANPPKAEA